MVKLLSQCFMLLCFFLPWCMAGECVRICAEMAQAARCCVSMRVEVWNVDADTKNYVALTAQETETVREILSLRLKPYAGLPCESDISWWQICSIQLLDAEGKVLCCVEDTDLTDEKRMAEDSDMAGLAVALVSEPDAAYIFSVFNRAVKSVE